MQKVNPKKRWFDCPDSKTKSEDGKREYYNVEARFHDHPVLNVEKSRIKRHNVYDYGIRLETRVKYAAGDVPAVRNTSPIPIRFDKGHALRREDFDATLTHIQRCWNAWEHFQTFREAPVTEHERIAIELIKMRPVASTILVDDGQGNLKAVRLDDPDDHDDDDADDFLDDDEAESGGDDAGGEAAAPPAAPARPRKPAPKSSKGKKAAAKPKRRAA